MENFAIQLQNYGTQIQNISMKLNNILMMQNYAFQLNQIGTQIVFIANQMLGMKFQNNQIINNIHYEDIYPYIKANKKNISFILPDKSIKNVKIPVTLKKDELYGTASQLNIYKYANIQLFYNNQLIDNNDSNINFISNGDQIIINEVMDYDPSFYDSLFTNNYSGFRNIKFINNDDFKTILICPFPNDITAKKLIQAFLNKMHIPYQKRDYFSFQIKYSSSILDKDDDVNSLSSSNFSAIIVRKAAIFPDNFYGKMLKVEFKIDVMNTDKNTFQGYTGTLMQIENFYHEIKGLLDRLNVAWSYEMLESPIIYPGEINIQSNDERTLGDIGIRQNFICKIKARIR